MSYMYTAKFGRRIPGIRQIGQNMASRISGNISIRCISIMKSILVQTENF